MYEHQPVAGINPFVTNKGTRYFLIGREIETLKWCGFTGGFEQQKDRSLIHTAIRELMEESCNVFLPWKKEVYDKLINNKCKLIRGKSARKRDIYTWFVEFSPSIKELNLEEKFQGNRTKMFDVHYLEKEKIKWVSEHKIFDEELGKGFRKDLKTFLSS